MRAFPLWPGNPKRLPFDDACRGSNRDMRLRMSLSYASQAGPCGVNPAYQPGSRAVGQPLAIPQSYIALGHTRSEERKLMLHCSNALRYYYKWGHASNPMPSYATTETDRQRRVDRQRRTDRRTHDRAMQTRHPRSRLHQPHRNRQESGAREPHVPAVYPVSKGGKYGQSIK